MKIRNLIGALAFGIIANTTAFAQIDSPALLGTIQSINEEISTQRADLGNMKAQINAVERDNNEFRRSVLSELLTLRRQNQQLIDSLFSQASTTSKGGNIMDIKPVRDYNLQTPDGKLFFGADEYIYIKEANAILDARIDTGAAVSSIHATNITEFERKSKKWYRFTISANDREIQVEAPFVRYSEIRQASKDTTTIRPVVLLTIKVGEFSTTSEFTLSDRSKLAYPLLIGRSLLKDVAVVDVSRDHIQPKGSNSKEVLLILNRNSYNDLKKKGINPNKEYDNLIKNTKGKIAYPAKEYGSNLGTNPEKALPEVSSKIDNNKKNN